MRYPVIRLSGYPVTSEPSRRNFNRITSYPVNMLSFKRDGPTRFGQAVLVIIGVIAALGLITGSAAMNSIFWFRLGSHPLESGYYGRASVCFDVFKALLPVWIAGALVARKFWYPLIASAVFALLLMGSFCSAIGFVATERGEKSGNQDSVNARYVLVQNDLAELDGKLSRLSGYPPIDAIEANLAGLRQDKRWASSKSCEAATTSRDFCKQYMDTKAQLASATEAKRLSDRRYEVNAEASRLLASGAGKDANPQASMLTNLVNRVRPGLQMSDVNMAIVTGFALLVELGAAFGLFLALRHLPKKPMPERMAPAPEAVPLQKVARDH